MLVERYSVVIVCREWMLATSSGRPSDESPSLMTPTSGFLLRYRWPGFELQYVCRGLLYQMLCSI